MEIIDRNEMGNDRTLYYTQVADVVISTISLDLPELRAMDELINMVEDMHEISPEDYRASGADLRTPGDWETMVFLCDSEGKITDFCELDFARYETEEDAHTGHAKMTEKWLNLKEMEQELKS